MTDRRKRANNLPALRAEIVPQPLLPALPASSGAWLGTRKHILNKDREFIEAHTRLLKAKSEQSDAATALAKSRMTAALTMAMLDTLPEIAEHEYQRGRSDRRREEGEWRHQERIAAIEHERDELDAQAALVRARQRLADLQPMPPQPLSEPAPEPPAGLTPHEVEDVLAALPEISPETLKTISLILAGLLKEKRG